MAEERFDHLRLEHSGERLLHVLEQLVDDLVLANVDLGRVGDATGGRLHLGVEPDDDRVRCRGQRQVRLLDVADGVVDDRERDLGLRHLREGALDRLERALHVGLEDDLELLGLALFDLREHLVEGRRSFRRGTRRALACVLRHDGSGSLLVRDDAHDVTRLRNLGETEDLDRP